MSTEKNKAKKFSSIAECDSERRLAWRKYFKEMESRKEDQRLYNRQIVGRTFQRYNDFTSTIKYLKENKVPVPPAMKIAMDETKKEITCSTCDNLLNPNTMYFCGEHNTCEECHTKQMVKREKEKDKAKKESDYPRHISECRACHLKYKKSIARKEGETK